MSGNLGQILSEIDVKISLWTAGRLLLLEICERIFIKILEKNDAALSEVISRVKLNKIQRWILKGILN